MKGMSQTLRKSLTEKNANFGRLCLARGTIFSLFFVCRCYRQKSYSRPIATAIKFSHIEMGAREVWIDGARTSVRADDAFIVPAGAQHNVVNTGSEPLRVYTIYGPPEHRDGVIHPTKANAEANEEHFDGKTTE